ncbi:MAG: HTH domain-containing protein [Thermoanaerobaculia bacterium]
MRNTVPSPFEAELLDLLRVAGGPVKRADLAMLLGKTERSIRSTVARLIRKGIPVISLGGGFQVDYDPAHRAAAARSLRAAAFSLLKRAANLAGTTAHVQAKQMTLELRAA